MCIYSGTLFYFLSLDESISNFWLLLDMPGLSVSHSLSFFTLDEFVSKAILFQRKQLVLIVDFLSTIAEIMHGIFAGDVLPSGLPVTVFAAEVSELAFIFEVLFQVFNCTETFCPASLIAAAKVKIFASFQVLCLLLITYILGRLLLAF